jgi:hypothetical protein
MAATDCTAFAVYGQAYRCYLEFINSSTGLTFSGSLATLSCTLIKDGANPVAPTNAIAQVGTTGIVYLDLTAAEMSYNCTIVLPASTASDAICRPRPLVPLNLVNTASTNGERFDQQTPVRFEQAIIDLLSLTGENGANQDGAALQTFNSDGSPRGQSTVQQNQLSGIRGSWQPVP